MSKRRHRLIPHLETVESRALLSNVLPVLTMRTYGHVRSELNHDLAAAVRTRNLSQLTSSMHELSGQVPFGGKQLFPLWQASLGTYQPKMPGSALALRRELLADLNGYITQGVKSNELRVTGPGSARFSKGLGNPASGPIGPISVGRPSNVTVFPNPPVASGSTVPYTVNYNTGYLNGSVTFTIPINSLQGGQFVLNAAGQNRINWNLSRTMLLTGYKFTIIYPGTTAQGAAFVMNGASDQSNFFRVITFSASGGMLNQVVTMTNPTRPQFTYAYFQPVVTFRTFLPGNVVIQETPLFSNG